MHAFAILHQATVTSSLIPFVCMCVRVRACVRARAFTSVVQKLWTDLNKIPPQRGFERSKAAITVCGVEVSNYERR
jgi:hypothetical protein